MFAALCGTRSRPAVELYFDYEDARPGVGLLREWVTGFPGRSWSGLRRCWSVTDFGPDAGKGEAVEKVLAGAGFTTVVGPDDEPVSLRGLVFGDASRPSAPSADPATVGIFPLDYDHTLTGLRAVGVEDLDSVSPATAVSMRAFGVGTVYDLLHLVPRRYIDLSNPQSVTDVEPGEQVAVIGKITSVNPGADSHAMSRINVRDSCGTVIPAGSSTPPG